VVTGYSTRFNGPLVYYFAHRGFICLCFRDDPVRRSGKRRVRLALAGALMASSPQLSTLMEDKQGALWIGTTGGGLSRREAEASPARRKDW